VALRTPMTSRQRVQAALRRKPTDRVPVFMWFHPVTAARLGRLLEIPPSRVSEAMGDDIALGDGLRKLYGAYYSASEMDHVTVVGYDDKTVFVIPGDRDGAVPIPAKYSGLVVK